MVCTMRFCNNLHQVPIRSQLAYQMCQLASIKQSSLSCWSSTTPALLFNHIKHVSKYKKYFTKKTDENPGFKVGYMYKLERNNAKRHNLG
jgi:hypothetical protein